MAGRPPPSWPDAERALAEFYAAQERRRAEVASATEPQATEPPAMAPHSASAAELPTTPPEPQATEPQAVYPHSASAAGLPPPQPEPQATEPQAVYTEYFDMGSVTSLVPASCDSISTSSWIQVGSVVDSPWETASCSGISSALSLAAWQECSTASYAGTHDQHVYDYQPRPYTPYTGVVTEPHPLHPLPQPQASSPPPPALSPPPQASSPPSDYYGMVGGRRAIHPAIPAGVGSSNALAGLRDPPVWTTGHHHPPTWTGVRAFQWREQ